MSKRRPAIGPLTEMDAAIERSRELLVESRIMLRWLDHVMSKIAFKSIEPLVDE